MRRLIVNADDFGSSSDANRAIVECHVRGIVTSTSLMVKRPAAAEAADLATRHPELSVGLHWDAGDESDEMDLGDADAVRGEFEQQLGLFQRTFGRMPTHVDSHRNVHRRWRVLPLFLELAAPLRVPVRATGPVRLIEDFYAGSDGREADLENVGVAKLERLLEERVRDGWTELACHPTYGSAAREAEVRTLTNPELVRKLEALGIEVVSYARAPIE